jgi:hypothetical protein
MTLHQRPEHPRLFPPPDAVVAGTGGCRWWWVGAGASLAVYPDGGGVLTWMVASSHGPETWRARVAVDARTVTAIERQFDSRGLRPPGTGAG